MPSCHLQAAVSSQWKGQVAECSYLVTLHGAKAPDDQMVLKFDALPGILGNVYTLEYCDL